MENNIELKTVKDLSQYSFYIPSYQRGYRWTEREVKDLLNDIDEFSPREVPGTDQKTWYCLQPVVVRKKADGTFEVIDGQQRLTTLYLILFYLNQDFVEKSRDKLFSIDYQTRDKSKEFLKNPENEDDSNIDFFYIHKAYKTIQSWFEGKEKDLAFDKNAYRSKLNFSTKVIWYQTYESVPTQVFTRLNIGKISLANAELIKALFLNSSHFRCKDKDELRLRQVEIANEWDAIENAFQKDKFWYFLSGQDVEDNRIDFIFNLMNRQQNSDPYSAFRYFSGELAGKSEEEMKQNWEAVQEYYQRFREWYDDRELYHKIGFILTAGIADVQRLYQESHDRKKSEFKPYLDSLIKRRYKNLSLFDLDCEDAKDVKSVLLLYNILTMLQNEHDFSYFPFDDFKKDRWNIEHIASRKDPSSVPANMRKTWLEDVSCYIDQSKEDGKSLIQEIQECLLKEDFSDSAFNPLYEKATDHFNYDFKSESDLNGISNLALLDESTNKGYKNAVFPVKRKKIIDLDKSGGFVPLCTKNVFLKYFSDYPPKISFWTREDREKYEEDLARVLRDYLEVES